FRQRFVIPGSDDEAATSIFENLAGRANVEGDDRSLARDRLYHAARQSLVARGDGHGVERSVPVGHVLLVTGEGDRRFDTRVLSLLKTATSVIVPLGVEVAHEVDARARGQTQEARDCLPYEIELPLARLEGRDDADGEAVRL